MERVKSYFKNNLNKIVTSITINSEIPNRCYHCGYGKILTGQVTLKKLESEEYFEDNNSEESNSKEYSEDNNSKEYSEETFNFVYKTGCLSYDEEMNYD